MRHFHHEDRRPRHERYAEQMRVQGYHLHVNHVQGYAEWRRTARRPHGLSYALACRILRDAPHATDRTAPGYRVRRVYERAA